MIINTGQHILDIAMSCHAGRVFLVSKLIPISKPIDVHEACNVVQAYAPDLIELDPDDLFSESYLLRFEDGSIYIYTKDAPDSFHPNITEWLTLEGRTLAHDGATLTAYLDA